MKINVQENSKGYQALKTNDMDENVLDIYETDKDVI